MEKIAPPLEKLLGAPLTASHMDLKTPRQQQQRPDLSHNSRCKDPGWETVHDVRSGHNYHRWAFWKLRQMKTSLNDISPEGPDSPQKCRCLIAYVMNASFQNQHIDKDGQRVM